MLDLALTYSKSPFKNVIKYTVDILSIVISFLLTGYILTFPPENWMVGDIAFLLVISFVCSYFLEVHNHLWRTISFYSVNHVVKFSLSITVLYSVWYLFFNASGEEVFKFSLVFLLLSTSFLTLSRVMVRLINEKQSFSNTKERQNLILIGAGKGGEIFLRELKKRHNESYHVAGILDDDPDLWGKRFFGIKVHGPIKDLPKLTSQTGINKIAIAIPSLSQRKHQEIASMAKELDLSVNVLPTFSELLTNTQGNLENIPIEDLLGRNTINLENEEVSSFIHNKTILITGAGGSIGSELCRQLIQFQPKEIIVLDHSEFNLYEISWELENTYNFFNFTPFLADVTDQTTIEEIITKCQPDIIFHAAAYKHVPLLENQAIQAIKNNFFGTKVVAELAAKYGCEKFILISTDKAVNPTNVMGTTKRMAELHCQSLNETGKTKFVTVRFGNVLESTGSVVPLFKKQLKQGGPLTVTHPDITRYFMSIPEASQLVLEAGAMGNGGEIYVLDMGEPIKIATLAERLILLSGKKPHTDIEILYTGLRPGEKLYEELFYDSEGHKPTGKRKILLAQSKQTAVQNFDKHIKELESSLRKSDILQVLRIMCKLVPESQLQTKKIN